MGARHAVQVRGVADAIQRTVSGKADYGWARQYAAGHPPGLDRPLTPPAGQPANSPGG